MLGSLWASDLEHVCRWLSAIRLGDYSWDSSHIGSICVVINTDNVEVIETFSDLAKLVFILLVVQSGSHRFNRLVSFCLSVLWHEKRLICDSMVVVERLALNDFLLEQEVVVCSGWVVHVSFKAQFDMIVTDGHVFTRLHVFNDIFKYFNLVDAYLDPVR